VDVKEPSQVLVERATTVELAVDVGR